MNWKAGRGYKYSCQNIAQKVESVNERVLAIEKGVRMASSTAHIPSLNDNFSGYTQFFRFIRHQDRMWPSLPLRGNLHL
jgi:hypothetical protein